MTPLQHSLQAPHSLASSVASELDDSFNPPANYRQTASSANPRHDRTFALPDARFSCKVVPYLPKGQLYDRAT
jgi:hypothetical protein